MQRGKPLAALPTECSAIEENLHSRMRCRDGEGGPGTTPVKMDRTPLPVANRLGGASFSGSSFKTPLGRQRACVHTKDTRDAMKRDCFFLVVHVPEHGEQDINACEGC